MTLEAKKLDLITHITQLDTDELLSQLQALFYQWINKEQLLKSLSIPIRQKTDLDEIMREQNYQGFNRQVFDELIREINIQEPVEELIQMI